VKGHLGAISLVTSRSANFPALREFVKVRAAHDEELWKEYTKPRWARQRMKLYHGKRHAFSNLFNQLSAIKETKSQRLVVAFGAGR